MFPFLKFNGIDDLGFVFREEFVIRFGVLYKLRNLGVSRELFGKFVIRFWILGQLGLFPDLECVLNLT